MKSGKRQAGCTRRGIRALWVICALTSLPAVAEDTRAAPAPAPPPGVITAIEFVGNKVTRARVMRQEMVVKEGDIADPVLIENSRQAIMDLGLFTSVRAFVEPRANGALLRIVVKEKYYILPVPKLNRDDDNNISYGAEVSFDNLAGLNQKLKLRYESEDSEQVRGEKIVTNLLSYSYPRLNGSMWTLGADISKTLTPAGVTSGGAMLYETEAWTASAQASRWLNPLDQSRGWQLGGGLVWRHNAYDYVSSTPVSPLPDAQAVGVSLLAQHVDVRDYLYSRSGKEYGYYGEIGVPTLGSDTSYTRHEFFHRTYLLLDGRPHENIDIQGRLGLSSGDIFPSDTYAYSLGGSKTLRGYSTGSFTGNSYILVNVQYLRPLFKNYALRSVLFLDIGNTYPSNNEMHLGAVKWDFGVGIRWRIKSLVKIDLRVDVAYVYETGKFNTFFGTKEIF